MTALQMEHWPLSRLLPYARNPRVNDPAVDRMAGVIREFGFRMPCVAKSTGELIDGHLRLKAAYKLGLETVPVVLADELSDTQIKAFRLLANRSATWAEWDEELLGLELTELQDAGFDLGLTGFNADEWESLIAGEPASKTGQTDDDAAPETPEAPVSRLGDVWVLGEHTLLCGDATLADSYTALLGDAPVNLIWTDPPYNVDYPNVSKTHPAFKRKRPILNDRLGAACFDDFLRDALSGMLPRCTGAVYIAMASAELDTLQAAFGAAGGHWSTFIIWAKNHFTLGHADYQRQYEAILYGWREGVNRHWCGDRDQSDLWSIDKPVKNDLHPTMKPVALVERAVRNSSRPGDIVLDPFAGSGTTLIAAEKAGRKARLMELDPKYCDVICQRWQAWRGQPAKRASDGQTFEAVQSIEPGISAALNRPGT